MARNRIDLTGLCFGRLKVLHLVSSGRNQPTMWACECVCGNRKTVWSYSLRNGDTKSCGCLQRELLAKRRKLPFGEAQINDSYTNYRYGAHKRNLQFDLSKEHFASLVRLPCMYCGATPNQGSSKLSGRVNGIDRVVPTHGYTKMNVVTCCWTCNKAKNDMTRAEFLAWIKQVFIYTRRENV